jgi:hypothetical protein
MTFKAECPALMGPSKEFMAYFVMQKTDENEFIR